MTTPALSDDFASRRRPLLTVVPDLEPEPEPNVWVEVDGETVCAFGFILLGLVALAKFLSGFDGDWARLGWCLLAAVAALPLIMIAANLIEFAQRHAK